MKQLRSVIAFGLVLTMILSLGCASIVSKSTYPVSITSNPDGADIVISDKHGKKVYTGRTPTTVSLKAGCGYFQGENYTVKFNKSGYNEHTAAISRGVDGWYILGNLVFGGLIGYLIVDPATGAMWKLDDMTVSLMEKDVSHNSEDSVLRIVRLEDIPQSFRSGLVPIN